MRRPELGEMNAFLTVAERRSFAKAAVQLGISRSRLSETIRALEDKLSVRLLNRTLVPLLEDWRPRSAAILSEPATDTAAAAGVHRVPAGEPADALRREGVMRPDRPDPVH